MISQSDSTNQQYYEIVKDGEKVSVKGPFAVKEVREAEDNSINVTAEALSLLRCCIILFARQP